MVGDWQKVVNDARLKKVVSIALNSNRDVQKALADIEAARAQYGETRASLFPTVDAELSHTRSKTVASGLSSASQADGAVSSFELDLFGKNQSLSRAARETWLASEFTAQNTRLTMIADLTTAWVTLATDNSNLALAQQTMDSAANSRNIVARQMAVGTASAGDLSSAESVYQQARAASPAIARWWRRIKTPLTCWRGKPCRRACCPALSRVSGITASRWCRRACRRRCCCVGRTFRKRSTI